MLSQIRICEVVGKDRNFWKYAGQRLTHISQTKTVVYKLKEDFVYWFVVRKNLSKFFEIHFHFPRFCISKTCVKQGNYEIQKLGLRDEFNYLNLWKLLEKWERLLFFDMLSTKTSVRFSKLFSSRSESSFENDDSV